MEEAAVARIGVLVKSPSSRPLLEFHRGGCNLQALERRARAEVLGERLVFPAMAFLLPRAEATAEYFVRRIAQFSSRMICFYSASYLQWLLEMLYVVTLSSL